MARAHEIEALLPSLIGEIYDAALDPQLLPGFITRLRQAFVAGGGTILSYNRLVPEMNFIHWDGYDPTSVASYMEHYFQHDFWEHGIRDVPVGEAATDVMLASAETMQRSEFLHDWLRPNDLLYSIGGVLERTPDAHILMSVLRSPKAGPIATVELDVFRQLIPHVRRALQIRRQLALGGTTSAVAAEGLARLATGAILVDGTARVLFANAVAERFLQAGNGIEAKNGTLVASLRSANAKLQELIGQAVATSAGKGRDAGGALLLPRRAGRPLSVLVCPLNAETMPFGFPSPLAIVFVRDPDKAAVAGVQALRRLFNLTPTEARLAQALVSGRSVDDFAETNRISVQTARTHLKNLMAKTWTRRQGELIALLLNGGIDTQAG